MVESSDVEPEPDESPAPAVMTALLGVASAVLFMTGLLVSESFGEFALDIDLKPFFLPYLLIALSRYGIPTLSVGLGGAIGGGILDVLDTSSGMIYQIAQKTSNAEILRLTTEVTLD